MKHGHLTSLSEQQLLDCSWKYWNYGCFRGTFNHAYKYVRDQGGIDTEEAYPYIAASVAECNYEKKYRAAQVSGFVSVPSEDDLLKAGISAGTIRLSIGIEDVDDLLEDLSKGLHKAAKVAAGGR